MLNLNRDHEMKKFPEIRSIPLEPCQAGVALDDGIRGFWYISDKAQNVLTSLSAKDDHWLVVHRFRSYVDCKAFDSEDVKLAFKLEVPFDVANEQRMIAHIEDFYDTCRKVHKEAGKEHQLMEDYTLIRGEADLTTFMKEFEKLPFVHIKSVSKKEFEKQHKGKVDFQK